MRGACIAVIGGIFWGLAGVFGQYLFAYKGLNARWLVSVRLVLAGLLLLTTVYLKQGREMWKIWKDKKGCILADFICHLRDGRMPAYLLFLCGII